MGRGGKGRDGNLTPVGGSGMWKCSREEGVLRRAVCVVGVAGCPAPGTARHGALLPVGQRVVWRPGGLRVAI